jgi:hypothetical protein
MKLANNTADKSNGFYCGSAVCSYSADAGHNTGCTNCFLCFTYSFNANPMMFHRLMEERFIPNSFQLLIFTYLIVHRY